jgi:hypothetical protein
MIGSGETAAPAQHQTDPQRNYVSADGGEVGQILIIDQEQ